MEIINPHTLKDCLCIETGSRFLVVPYSLDVVILIIVADVLVPNGHQVNSSHYAERTVIIVSGETYGAICIYIYNVAELILCGWEIVWSTLVQVKAWCDQASRHYLFPSLTCHWISGWWVCYTTALTHWGQVTHICISKIIIIGSDYGLLPGRCQAIIWTNAGTLLTAHLGINFSEILIEINTFSSNKMHMKMLSAKWRLFYLGLNRLMLFLVSFHKRVYELIIQIL